MLPLLVEEKHYKYWNKNLKFIHQMPQTLAINHVNPFDSTHVSHTTI